MSSEPARHENYGVPSSYTRDIIAQRPAETNLAFLRPYLQAGQQVLDAGCGPGSITVDLAEIVTPGEVVGIDLREADLHHARSLAQSRNVTNVRFETASIYAVPFPDASFDVAIAHLVLLHLSDPLAALTELRRVLKPGGVVGIADTAFQSCLRYPEDPRLDRYDALAARTLQHHGGSPFYAPTQRALLRAAGFSRTEGQARPGPSSRGAAGNPERVQTTARNQLNLLEHWIGPLAVAQGWASPTELEEIAEAWRTWSEHPDAFLLRPICCAIGWV